MKSHRTRFLKAISVLLMAFPVVYLLLVVMVFDIPASNIGKMIFSPLFWVTCLFGVMTGYGFWEMKRWSWYTFVALLIFIGLENLTIAFRIGETHHPILSFLVFSFMLIGIAYQVTHEIKVPYFLPKIRWWESNPRYRLSMPVLLERKGGESLKGEILDLSMGGCFIKVRHDFSQEEQLGLSFSIFGELIDTSGIVVWRSHRTVTHPKGIGVKFGPLELEDKRILRRVTLKLRKISALYRRTRKGQDQDEFLKQMEELQFGPNSEDKK